MAAVKSYENALYILHCITGFQRGKRVGGGGGGGGGHS